MTPSKLLAWLRAHGEPISVRQIAALHQKETGTFAEKRIQHAMKDLERAGLVEFDKGPNNSKLWKVAPPVATGTPVEADAGN